MFIDSYFDWFKYFTFNFHSIQSSIEFFEMPKKKKASFFDDEKEESSSTDSSYPPESKDSFPSFTQSSNPFQSPSYQQPPPATPFPPQEQEPTSQACVPPTGQVDQMNI